jgi:hypothetical protein
VSGRPAEVSHWIKSTRAGLIKFNPKIAAEDTYPHRFLDWWERENPAWRERQDGKLMLGGLGSWSSMWTMGPNGWVNIIAGLVALHSKANPDKWGYALQDIHWVLGQVLAAKRNNPYVMF